MQCLKKDLMGNAVPKDGVLLLDKPLGLSSAKALSRVKYLLSAHKAGHTGTLDPLATGLLPLCFGEATKFSQHLLCENKTYEADICLGTTTTTGDTEGSIVEKKNINCSLELIRHTLQKFTGEINQIPPMYSALKRQGRPLYAYARMGQEVVREERKVVIYQLTLLNLALPVMTVRIFCSKGTYIRTLAEDLGQALGCGAHLSTLRRTTVGDLSLPQAITLQDLESLSLIERIKKLAPIDILIQHLPKVNLTTGLARRFLYGQRLFLNEYLPETLLRVYNDKYLLGIAQFKHGILKPQRLIKKSTLDLFQDCTFSA